MNFDALEELDLNHAEYCFLMEDTNLYSDTFKVFIPKYMPFLSLNDKPKKTDVKFNNNIFINDVTNKPSTTPSITTQNYLSLKRFKNSWFRFHPNIIEKKTRFICKSLDGNIRNVFITDDEFNVEKTEKKNNIYVRNPSFEILDKINVGDTVHVYYRTYILTDIGSCQNKIEHYEENHDGCVFECKDGEGRNVSCTRKYCRIAKIESGNGTVVAKQAWGLMVFIGGKQRHIPPEQIIGFYKKPGEYYSYY